MEKIQDCLGCSLARKELQTYVVYEDDIVTCILDHDPFNEGHVLLLPKRHTRYIDEFDTETAQSVMKTVQLLSVAIKSAYSPDGISICQNGGAFDDLTHFHMHVVPRQQGQDFSRFYTDEPWNNEAIKKRLPETRERLATVIEEIAAY